MTPFGRIATPDERVMERLAGLLRRGTSLSPFVTAGEALANAVLSTRGQALPTWAERLADAMVGALIVVQQRSQGDLDPDTRVGLASAAATLSIVRPRVARVCTNAIGVWMGAVGPASSHGTAEVLAARTLLFLALGDDDAAVHAVDELVERGGAAAGWVLHDWTVSRLQRHGVGREAQCFHNLRLALSGRSAAMLQVLAARVVVGRLDGDAAAVLPWLDEVAYDIVEQGTSCRASA